MTFSRRTFAASLFAAPAAAAVATTLPQGAFGAPLASRPPFAQMTIGRFKVTFITDGFHDLPFGFFTNTNQDELAGRAQARGADRGGALRLNFTQYLIEENGRKILVDTGPAGLIGDNTGRLPAAFAALGLTPDEIDAVILTHTHFDHIGGMVSGGKAVYQGADVYVDRRDIAYFTDPAARSGAPEFLHSSFDATAALVAAYPNLQQTNGAQQIVPGLDLVDLTGHTPGHVGVRVSDGGQSLIISSDMLFHPLIHPVSAAAGFVFEQDPAAAEAMRARFFSQAAAEGTLVAATHMPFPGLGRIVADRGQLEWVPAEWVS